MLLSHCAKMWFKGASLTYQRIFFASDNSWLPSQQPQLMSRLRRCDSQNKKSDVLGHGQSISFSWRIFSWTKIRPGVILNFRLTLNQHSLSTLRQETNSTCCSEPWGLGQNLIRLDNFARPIKGGVIYKVIILELISMAEQIDTGNNKKAVSFASGLPADLIKKAYLERALLIK